jgi:hypothetical protein
LLIYFYNQVDMIEQDDTSPSSDGASGSSSSPRQAMEQVVDADVDVDISHVRYTIHIRLPWSLVRTQKWPRPIPVRHDKLVVDCVFVARIIALDKVCMYKVVGWMWSPTRNDYRIYYYNVDNVAGGVAEAPAIVLDESRIAYTYAAQFDTVFSVSSITTPQVIANDEEVDIVID